MTDYLDLETVLLVGAIAVLLLNVFAIPLVYMRKPPINRLFVSIATGLFTVLDVACIGFLTHRPGLAAIVCAFYLILWHGWLWVPVKRNHQ